MKKVLMMLMVMVMIVSAVEVIGQAPITMVRKSDAAELKGHVELAYSPGTGNTHGSFILCFYLNGTPDTYMTGVAINRNFLTSVINSRTLAQGVTTSRKLNSEQTLMIGEGYQMTMVDDRLNHEVFPDNVYIMSCLSLQKSGGIGVVSPAQHAAVKALFERGKTYQQEILRAKGITI